MQASRHFALIIGIANYQHITPLSAAVIRDASAVKDLLLDPNYCAYPTENVQLLTDADATDSNIRRALEQLATQTETDSVVTIYYSGHGGRLGAGDQDQTWLLPVDARFATDEQLQYAISGVEFSAYLYHIPARKRLVIFDCCHAGGIGQPKSGKPYHLKQGLDDAYYRQLGSGQGCAIVASSLASETSAILFGDDHSLFTKHLLAGLRGGIPSHDGFIRVFELFSHIQQQVQAEAQQNRLQQSPFFQCALQDNFPVALYRSGYKEPYPAPAASTTVRPSQSDGSYDFDVYLSYLAEPDDNADRVWVEEELMPSLARHDLRLASCHAAAVLGVTRLDGEHTGMTCARRTLVIISQQSLQDELAGFESHMAQYMGLLESRYRVIPIYREAVDKKRVPLRLGMILGINLASTRAEQEFERLITALKSPLPTTHTR